ncbi:hypothetical protein EJB05_09660, partial [Eragrostis curvula]
MALRNRRGFASALARQRRPPGRQGATTAATPRLARGSGDGGPQADELHGLEFAVSGDESAASDAEEERVEFNFAVAAGDDVVASGGGAEVVAVDAVAATGEESGDSKEMEKAEKDGAEEVAPPPASLLCPATKFRVLMLKLRKLKGAVAVPPTRTGRRRSRPRSLKMCTGSFRRAAPVLDTTAEGREDPVLWRSILATAACLYRADQLHFKVDLHGMAATAVRRSAGQCEAFWGEYAGDDRFIRYLSESYKCAELCMMFQNL